MPPRAKIGASRQIRINAAPREWDALFAYAEAMNVTPNQAAMEMLLTALTDNVSNATFIAAARRARHDAQKIVMVESIKAIGNAWQRLVERAIEMGIELDTSHVAALRKDPT